MLLQYHFLVFVVAVKELTVDGLQKHDYLLSKFLQVTHLYTKDRRAITIIIPQKNNKSNPVRQEPNPSY